MTNKNTVGGYWVDVTDRLPKRVQGAYGPIELYCKTFCGIEIIEFMDFDETGALNPGVFYDESVTQWLCIPGVTLAE